MAARGLSRCWDAATGATLRIIQLERLAPISVATDRCEGNVNRHLGRVQLDSGCRPDLQDDVVCDLRVCRARNGGAGAVAWNDRSCRAPQDAVSGYLFQDDCGCLRDRYKLPLRLWVTVLGCIADLNDDVERSGGGSRHRCDDVEGSVLDRCAFLRLSNVRD